MAVDGGATDVMESIARLAEKLIERKMSDDERRDANLVVAALKLGLHERQGMWLLCLNNADNWKVSGILNEVCRIAGPSRGNGWVVVTSRQSQPRVWAGMKED